MYTTQTRSQVDAAIAPKNRCRTATNLHVHEGNSQGLFRTMFFTGGSAMMLPMLDMSTEHTYIALLIVSFLAATLLPLGSEWLLVALLLGGKSPILVVVIATVGNTLGGATNYLIGRWGSTWLISKVLRINPDQQQQAQDWFQRYGSLSLLFSWLPVVGDPLCLVAGTLRTSLARFFVLVTTGKALRYISLTWLTLRGSELLR